MVSVNQLNIVLGFSVSYFSNYFLLQLSQTDSGWFASQVDQHNVWRWMLGMEILPALAWFLLLFTIPRSPRWLLLNNQKEEAYRVLHRLFNKQEARDQIEEICQLNQREKPSLGEALSDLFSPKLRFALFIGLIVGISQQVTGINVIFFYAPTVFEQSGVGTNAAFMQAIWIGLVNVVFTLVAMATIDRFGRKPLLVIGLTGVIISMGVCGYGFHQATYLLTEQDLSMLQQQQILDTQLLQPLVNQSYDSDVAFKQALIDALGKSTFQQHQGELMKYATEMNATLILFGIMAFVASFAMSLGPVMWVMFSEIFPNHIRGIAISLVGVVNSAVSFTVQLVFPWELATLGSAMTFLGYGLFASIGLVLVLRYVPETKGKTLEQLEQLLSRDL
jgi:MFS family permease